MCVVGLSTIVIKEYYTRLQTQYVGDEELNGRIVGDVWIVGQFFWRILGK